MIKIVGYKLVQKDGKEVWRPIYKDLGPVPPRWWEDSPTRYTSVKKQMEAP